MSDPLREKMQMDTNIIADKIDARQLAIDRMAERPLPRDTDGKIKPPNKQDVEFQAVME